MEFSLKYLTNNFPKTFEMVAFINLIINGLLHHEVKSKKTLLMELLI